MAKLITAKDVQGWSQTCTGPRFLLAGGHILSPGALDAARGLGVQVVYPGSSLTSLLRKLAEEATGNALGREELAELERQVVAKIKEREGKE